MLRKNHIKQLFVVTFLCAGLISCDDKEKIVVQGEDFYFEDKATMVSEDDAKEFTLKFLSKMPESTENSYWPNAGYVPSENLKVNSDFEDYDYFSVGNKPKIGLNLTASPIVAEDKIFTIDGLGVIQARLIADLDEVIWEIEPEAQFAARNRDNGFFRSITNLFYDSDDFLGGNISYSLGTIYITTKRGNVGAFDASTGGQIWFKKIGLPIRSVPVAQKDNLIFTTIDNKTYNLNSKTGDQKWVHTGYEEKSKLYGNPSALIIGNDILVTYSSGEIFLLNLSTGKEVWSNIITPVVFAKLNPSINDIQYTAVYHKNIIYIVTGDETLVALDHKSGELIWSLSGHYISKKPWAIGEFVFTADSNGNLIAVAAKTGRVVWKSKLARSIDIEDDNLKFTNPIIVNGKILVADNDGTLRAYGPDDGGIIFETSIPSDVYIKPISAAGKLFILSNKATLAYF